MSLTDTFAIEYVTKTCQLAVQEISRRLRRKQQVIWCVDGERWELKRSGSVLGGQMFLADPTLWNVADMRRGLLQVWSGEAARVHGSVYGWAKDAWDKFDGPLVIVGKTFRAWSDEL